MELDLRYSILNKRLTAHAAVTAKPFTQAQMRNYLISVVATATTMTGMRKKSSTQRRTLREESIEQLRRLLESSFPT